MTFIFCKFKLKIFVRGKRVDPKNLEFAANPSESWREFRRPRPRRRFYSPSYQKYSIIVGVALGLVNVHRAAENVLEWEQPHRYTWSGLATSRRCWLPAKGAGRPCRGQDVSRVTPIPTAVFCSSLSLVKFLSTKADVNAKEKVIELEGVCKRYGSKLALQDVSLTIGPGVSGLLGPNGSGKSTLIKSLLGLLRLQAGQASVLGYRLPSQLHLIRDAVGYLPEDDCFIAGLTGIESVRFMAQLSGLAAVEALRRGHESMDFADIGQERYRNVETYSTGMRQKLKFAQAIVHDPALLILDEPTTGLDPQQRTSMLRKIKNLASKHGKSILISTHILHDVRSVCDQVVIMSQGRIRLVDSLENLSRPARSGVMVHVQKHRESTADEPFPDAQQLLRCLKNRGMDVELREQGGLWVRSVSEEDSRLIWHSAAQAGVYIERLSQAKNSLEEIFFNTVKESERATA